MQCPKCKNEIKYNSLYCDKCGTKVASVCSNCGNINSLLEKRCPKCNKELIHICNNCGAANLPNSTKCRKCGEIFNEKKNTITQKFVTSNSISQQKAKAELINSIKDSSKKIISLNGESGIGKNIVLKSVMEEIKEANIIWLIGNCTPLSQLSPLGFIQDLLLTFFNINNFCPNTLQLKKNSINFFKQDFPTLTNNEINDLLNLLYPEKLDIYENIYSNKAKLFVSLKKVFYTIIEKVKTILVIDKYENIDGMSHDFIEELISDEYFINRTKILIISTIEKPGLGRLHSLKLNSDNYTDINLAQFSKEQIDILLTQNINYKINNNILNKIYQISNGNPAIVEQIITYIKENNIETFSNDSLNNIETLIKNRLSFLKETDINAYKFLQATSILGYKFYPTILEHFNNNSTQEFERIIKKLINDNYINPINNLSFEFKSYTIWQIILNITKEENDNFINILNILKNSINIYKLSSIAILGYIEQHLNNTKEAFEIWTILMKQASYIGDVGLYIISQKQSLKIIEDKISPHYYKIKKNIYTRLGKLLEPIDPNTSFKYIQNAIMMLDDNEDIEYCNLLGYLASTSMQKSNYWGVIECTENMLKKLPEDLDFAKILVKSRQIHPLVKLGNYESAINLIDTEILPNIEKNLNKSKSTQYINIDKLYDVWLNIYFDLAEALCFQGHNRTFEIIKMIFDILEKNKSKDNQKYCKAYLALALANTIKGDIKTSNKILYDILKDFSFDELEKYIQSRWNFIDILNKFMTKDYNNLYTELFNVVAFANNINDNFTKNILKTLLAKILLDKNENKKTLEILEEQISYFAKEKISTGVLLAWYLIAQTRLITNGTQFALDIATKALDIAQSTSINNYYFIVLFNKLIGEIYMGKQDFDLAKVYIEKSIYIAKQFNLEALLVQNYILYAKFYQELALPKSKNRIQYIKQAFKLYQLAQSVPIVDGQKFIEKEIQENFSVLTSFCKLNRIVLKKSQS